MGMRLIDADRLKEVPMFNGHYDRKNANEHFIYGINTVMEFVDELPTEQPKTVPEELKQKMWNALYTEEDEYEKKFVGKEEHLNWFTVYRPWLQKGFNIAINAIADWEGR